jgi:hypothetical protein
MSKTEHAKRDTYHPYHDSFISQKGWWTPWPGWLA